MLLKKIILTIFVTVYALASMPVSAQEADPYAGNMPEIQKYEDFISLPIDTRLELYIAAVSRGASEEQLAVFHRDPAFVKKVFPRLSAAERARIVADAEKFPTKLPTQGAVTATGGTLQCFDYYRFGSVEASMETEVATAVSGTPVTLTGTVKNTNAYPVMDGRLYVRIFRKDTDLSSVAGNGHPVVDQFVVQDNMTIPASSSVPVTAKWNIPAYAQTGDYQAAFFFITSERFNLLGLSFTDDVIGNSVDFAVADGRTDGVSLNKNTVKVAGSAESYRFASFPQQVNPDKDVTVSYEVINTTKNAVQVPISYTLYSWDAQRAENVLATEDTFVELKAGEKKRVTYTDTSRTGSVHLLNVTIKYQDTKSLFNVRYVRDNVDMLRLNFPAVTSYPLVEGQETTLFSCFHNSGTATVPGAVVTLTLKDAQGAVIHTHTYNGSITGAMMASGEKFTPEKDYKDFTLTATLAKDGTVLDEVIIPYVCEAITPGDCADAEVATTTSESGSSTTLTIILLIALGVLVFAGFAGYLAYRRTQDGEPIPPAALLLALVFAGSLILPSVSEAKSAQWSSGPLPELWYYWDNGCGSGSGLCVGNGFAPGLLPGAQVTVTYKAQVVNVATGAIVNEGASLPVGTQIRIEKIPHADTDIVWFGTGTSLDSPYGFWSGNKEAPSNSLLQNFFVTDLGYSWGAIYIPLSVARPPVTVNTTGGNLACDVSGLCTVTGAGPLSANIAFWPTSGYFYYRYAASFANYFTGVPMARIPANIEQFLGSCINWIDYCYTLGSSTSEPPYILQVGAVIIPFSFTGVSNNNPPTTPVITGPTSGLTNNPYTFGFKATDPDNDTLRYGIDWTGLGVVNQWTTLAPSGTTGSAGRSWADIGGKTFRVLAEDSKGARSGWATHTISLSAVPVDGGWTEWSTWSTCSSACNGTQTRVRTCTNPTPANGGANCIGPNTETQACNAGAVNYGASCTSSANICSMTTTGTIQCSGSCSATTPAASSCPAAVVTFSASPTSIPNNGSTVLTWKAVGVQSCFAQTGWSGTKALNTTTSQTIANITQDTNFTLICSDYNNNAVTRHAPVTLFPPPTLTANPGTVQSGDTSALTYVLNGYTGCTLSGPGMASVSVTANGTKPTPVITAESIFTLACTGATVKATVRIKGTVTEQ